VAKERNQITVEGLLSQVLAEYGHRLAEYFAFYNIDNLPGHPALPVLKIYCFTNKTIMMKTFNTNSKLAWIAGTLLTLLPVYFIFISIMKYAFGWNYLFDISEPTLKNLGIDQSMGWNINLLIIFGPVLAFVLNVLSVLHVHFEITKERIDCRISISKNWKNLAIVILSTLVLLTLFAYLLGENCNCH
jgi:hypothetical protein